MDSVIKISYHKKLYLMVLSFIWIITISLIIFQYEILLSDWVSLAVIVSISLLVSIIAFFDTRRLVDIISNKQKKEKNRIRRELTDNLNHELKTPVASIQVCLETLLSGIDLTEEKRQELIGRCYVHNTRLRKLLASISLITRMERGSHLIEKEPVLINSIIDEIDEELKIMPANERFTLHTDFKDKVVVNGNISLIGSIFRNLTENAISYSGGKNIYISLVKNNNKFCKIRFEDDGNGVEEEKLLHLFERFYRVDNGRSRKKGGTGLGLTIVHHAVQFHGGTIVASNRKNGGLILEFTLKKC
jgi:signal transduction histidine kinase